MHIRITLLSATILALVLVACSGDSGSTNSNTSQQQPTQNVVADVQQPTIEQSDPTPTAETADISAQAAAEEIIPTEPSAAAEPVVIDRPDWQMIEFTDARSGETFSFADFAGKTIYVEPMATWCSNCTAQLRNVAAARNQLGTDDYVFIGLSLETYLNPSDLADHANDHGWDWPFAVLSDGALRSFVQEFGTSFGNAPSTPHFIIRPDGTWTALETGMKSTNALIEQLRQAGTEA